MARTTDLRIGFAMALAGGLAACSGGGGGGGVTAGTTSFQLSDVTVQDGSVWQINREIVFGFTEPIDFTSVSANTINIRSSSDVPATGVFRLRDAQTVVFQPTCPTRDDFSDAGLQPGETYILRMPGKNTSANTLRSTTGIQLGVQQTRTFSTPLSNQAQVIFQDTVSGAPRPVVRVANSPAASDPNASYLEVGAAGDRVYFERNGPAIDLIPEFGDTPADDAREAEFLALGAPLNLYSDAASRLAVHVAFNQPVNPSTTNISPSRLRLEFQDNQGTWRRIDTRVTLEENCSETGAMVRLEPIGVLPPSSHFRAVVEAGFQDIVGEPSLSAQATFAEAPTRAVSFTSLTSDQLSDEFQESYDFSGTSPLSYEDTNALFDTPVAEWGGGQLSAAFSFDGTGGPNGDFDWVVHTGEKIFFDTTSTPIIGGPGGLPTAIQDTVGGVVDVRNLTIEAGAEVRVQGPNPMRINATGDVRIFGLLDLSGFNAKDVATLDTGNQTEIGGSGTAGGGRGGTANDNVTGPTVRGGTGQGPFRQANLGGEGGEMGVDNFIDPNSRRPGGGGGGRFAKDWDEDVVTTVADLSTAAGPGGNGNDTTVGAVTGQSPALGGDPGVGPFIDNDDGNDFFGVRPVVSGGVLVGLVRGELTRIWAGYGGGGGGNASQRFPNPGWGPASDEKGGGGGGAGGALHIKALGRIVFGVDGQIQSNGARGGAGENTNFLDHIGGTGGAGSGGHVILESATLVDFTGDGSALGAPVRDAIQVCGPREKSGNTNPDYFPPGLVDRKISFGGAGGAGVIQIHVPEPTFAPSDDSLSDSDLLVPTSALALPNVLDGVTSPPPYVLVATFGRLSKARSDWISIGGADKKPGAGTPDGLVRFLFDGIETSGQDAGKIKTTGSTVQDLAPLVGDDDLAHSTSARILSDGYTLELTGAALTAIRAGTTSGISNDIYLRTAALLEDCTLRMRVVGRTFTDYTIVEATYDEGAASLGDEALRIRVATDLGKLSDFNTAPPLGVTGYHLLPRFFAVVTGGLPGNLPSTAYVRLRFQAARDNGVGAPDETNLLVPWTNDIAVFNQQPAGELQFFRYEVEFNLDAANEGITADTQAVALEFLKIPFVF